MLLPKSVHGDELWEISVQFHFSFQILIEVRPDSTPALVCAIGGERGVKETRGWGGLGGTCIVLLWTGFHHLRR